MQRAIQISGVGVQSTKISVMDVNDLPGFGVGVGRLQSFDGLLKLAVEKPQQDPSTANGLQSVPRNHYFG